MAMSGTIRRLSSALGALLFALPRVAFAQTSEPGLTTVDPRAHAEAISTGPPGSKPVASDSSHVFEAFRYYADSARSTRYAAAGSSLILGAALIGTGIAAEKAWDESYGTVVWVSGIVVAAGGAFGLVFRTEVEQMADEQGVYVTTAPTPEQEATLERKWAEAADKGRSVRYLGAGISFAFSAIALGVGIGIVASDMNEGPRHAWGTVLLTGAGAFAGAGVATLVMETPAEASYGAFAAARGKAPKGLESSAPTWRFGAAPLQRGGLVSVSTDF
jgi:hypothetical protein